MERIWIALSTDIVVEIMSKGPEGYWRGMLLSKAVRARVKVCMPKFEAVRRWSREVVEVGERNGRRIVSKYTVLPNGQKNGMEEETCEGHGPIVEKSKSFYVGGELLSRKMEFGRIVRRRFASNTMISWRDVGETSIVKRLEEDYELQIIFRNGVTKVLLEDYRTKNVYVEKWVGGKYVLEYWTDHPGPIHVYNTECRLSRIWEIVEGGAFREELEAELLLESM